MRDTRSDPSALRFLIGRDLRTAREKAGIKQVAAAKVLDCSPSKINYLEIGKTQQQPEEVRILLTAYGVGPEHIERTTSLAASADEATWWTTFDEVLPDWFKTFVGLEGLADSLFTYEVMQLPGQMQTPEYAKAILMGGLQIRPLDIAEAVAARMARQRLAAAVKPLQFQAVIDESVLHRTLGGPQVMAAQLKHVLQLMERDNVELRVMPFEVPVYVGLEGPFQLLTFAEAQSMAYIEYSTGAAYVQEHKQLHLYTLAAERLTETALSVSDSANMIARRITALKRD